MSRCILFIAAVMLCITACESSDLTDPNENQEQTGNNENNGTEDNVPSDGEGQGETEKVKFMTITLDRVTATKAVFKAYTKKTAPDLELGIYYSENKNEHIYDCQRVWDYDLDIGECCELEIEDLESETTYYYRPYLFANGVRELGDEFEFKTAQPKFTLDNVSADVLTATFTGYADYDCRVGIYCSTAPPSEYNYKTHHWIGAEDNNYTLTIDNLSSSTTYYYCTWVDEYANDNPVYGEVKSFTTGNPMITIDNVNIYENWVEFAGKAMLDCEGGILYSSSSTITKNDCLGIINLSNVASGYIKGCELPSFSTRYYYCTYYWDNTTSTYLYGQVRQLTTGGDVYDDAIKDLSSTLAIDLSADGAANCYIVSKAGTYKIKTVKGNDVNQLLANVFKPTILWETYGTDVKPTKLSLINGVCYKNGYLIFETSSSFKKGNAVIAVQDASGNILWSWHIWLTDQPQAQVYNNDAGTMMDRNLGATSATKGDVGALGLLYQWGRKDPFLGSSSISSSTLAKSTITWRPAVESNSSNGTIEYATAHPTTFITYNSSNRDWYYTGSSSTDNTRWTTSETAKSIYDPCPSGWRIPDGGSNGIWSKAGFAVTEYDSTNKGISFSISSPSKTWYPASGCRNNGDGSLSDVGYHGFYWSASPYYYRAYYLYFYYNGGVYPSSYYGRACGLSVRCLQE